MKLFLPITLGVVCIALAVFLHKTQKDDAARHDEDVSSIVSYSNRLDAAETQLNTRDQVILTLSNRLNECSSASLALSHQLAEARGTVQNQSGQITNLNQQRVRLTDQVAVFSNKLGLTEATLSQANKDYALLDNRLRRDIATRIVAERRFNNPAELQAQLQMLKTNPPAIITADAILAGLNIEVRSNGLCHVIAPD
jgi:hypothetical protein